MDKTKFIVVVGIIFVAIFIVVSIKSKQNNNSNINNESFDPFIYASVDHNPRIGLSSLDKCDLKSVLRDNLKEITANDNGLKFAPFRGYDTNRPNNRLESIEKKFNSAYDKGVTRQCDLKASMFHTRHPGLYQQRYNYEDQRMYLSGKKCFSKYEYPDALSPLISRSKGKQNLDEKNGARLWELPLHLKNWYHAKVPKHYPMIDDYYDPSHMLDKNDDRKRYLE
jgi:hypothetical protein